MRISKYEDINPNTEPINLDKIIVDGENVIWSAKPKKSAFIINKSLTMAPFAILWLIFDMSFIITFVSSGEAKEMLWFIIPFFALHLLPVWIWLSNVLTAKKRWDNTEYAVTDKRIIIQSGFIGLDYQSIYYKDIKDIHLNVGVIDKMLGVGDIYFSVTQGKKQAFLDIETPYELYPRLQKIVMDIQTDIEYPNDLRPKENHGYETEYTPR